MPTTTARCARMATVREVAARIIAMRWASGCVLSVGISASFEKLAKR